MRRLSLGRLSVAAAVALLVTMAPGAAHAANPMPSTGAASVASQRLQSYGVEVVNLSSQHFDEIVLAVTRHSSPTAQLIHRPDVSPGASVSFDLGDCADVKQYAVSGIVGGDRVITTGDIDGDSVGCADQLIFRNKGVTTR